MSKSTIDPVGLTMYVVYNNPSDYPNKYVVRKWIGLTPFPVPEIVADTLIKARSSIPVGLYRLPRQDGDDPCIMEIWI